MTIYVKRCKLQVASSLADFVEAKVLPGIGILPADFWLGFSKMIEDFGPTNKALLAERKKLQLEIDAWHVANRAVGFDAASYQSFLYEIGYLLPEGSNFLIETDNVDPEIAKIPGPQLVVPVMNARFALNAANARWGSLYDALYGTDAIGELPKEKGYDAERGQRVVSWAKDFLDVALPLSGANWSDVTSLSVEDNALILKINGQLSGLLNPLQYEGYRTNGIKRYFLFRNNGLGIEIATDPNNQIGRTDAASIADVNLESAVSTIMDCEDSIAAVDAEDKVLAYSNWLGLMKGDLEESFEKDGKIVERNLNSDTTFTSPDGSLFSVKCRSLMLVRNVGHLMTNAAVLDHNNQEVGEGLIDSIMTTLIAMYDLQKSQGLRNSVNGSVYVVKPKMHGPAEVAFADQIFTRVEVILGLPLNTVKLGIMDEERRTSANLKNCIRAAKSRIAFINTGFLDRTGDEIHTAMEAGQMIPKAEMKSAKWIVAYEDRNVDIGLECGLYGRAQIGKGMWAMPDLMADMLKEKVGHPEAGANCAWVPSPTAATLHATHYHQVDVLARQVELVAGSSRGTLADLLTIPIAGERNFSSEEIVFELENNAQGILGYVVRWIDQGIGCSKVPDINNVGLMEDRATCRISAQALTNWLHHGVVNENQVLEAFKKMAAIVDKQNSSDPTYISMAPNFDGIAFKAACDLVFTGRVQPSGYTEPVLHARRLEFKNNHFS